MTAEDFKEQKPGFKAWAIVELMGHVKIAGLVTEEELFGAKLGRCDIPDGKGSFITQYFNGSSLYRLTPTTEEIARSVAKENQPEPVYVWDLRRQLNAAPVRSIDDDEVDHADDDDEASFDDDDEEGELEDARIGYDTSAVEVGAQYLGTVTRLVDFGAFLEILPGVEGLLHISEIAPYRVRDVRDELTAGQQCLVKVLDKSESAVKLSRKALLQDQDDN